MIIQLSHIRRMTDSACICWFLTPQPLCTPHVHDVTVAHAIRSMIVQGPCLRRLAFNCHPHTPYPEDLERPTCQLKLPRSLRRLSKTSRSSSSLIGAPTASQTPPQCHIQRGFYNGSAVGVGLLVGPQNDFSVAGSRIQSRSTWSARLQLPLVNQDDPWQDKSPTRQPYSIRFGHQGPDQPSDSVLSQVADAISEAWPDATTAQHKRHVKLWPHTPVQTAAPMLDHVSAMDPILSWLASQTLLPGEGADVLFLTRSAKGNANMLRWDKISRVTTTITLSL